MEKEPTKFTKKERFEISTSMSPLNYEQKEIGP